MNALYPHLDALESALDRLTHHPETRAYGTYARDAHGEPVCPTSSTAVACCVLGDVLRHLGLTKKEADAELARTAPRALLLFSYYMAIDTLRNELGGDRKLRIGQHIDTLSDFDAAAFLAHAIQRERTRLAPKAP